MVSWERVERFRRGGWFVAKDTHLHVLRLDADTVPRPVAQIADSDFNSEIAVAASGESVVVADARNLWRFGLDGSRKHIAELGSINLRGRNPLRETHQIAGLVRLSASEEEVYFGVVDRARPHAGLCRLFLKTSTAELVDCPYYPAGADMPTGRPVVYAVGSGEPRAFVADFDTGGVIRLPVSRAYCACSLSRDARKLLLSGSGYQDEPITILHLETGEEELLPVRGSNASWLGGDIILFVRGSSALWQYSMRDCRVQGFLRPDLAGRYRAKGFALAPVLSKDESWMAWGWAGRGMLGSLSRGTVIVDLVRREQVQLRGWWRNLQFATETRNRDGSKAG